MPTDLITRPRRVKRTAKAGPSVPSSGSSVALGDEPKAIGSLAEPEGSALPCQNRNNSTEPVQKSPPVLTSGVGKSAFVLQENVKGLCARFGIERVGFLTLTFADHVVCAREASRRFNSLASHVLRERYPGYIRVLERQKSGRIHYHLLVVCASDIRSGVDFDAFGSGDYRSAPPLLRAEWKFWRATAKRYGFGRTELLPVRSTSHAVGRYVGKYIGKHFSSRVERDKGVRLVTYCGERVAINRISWVGGRSREWRAKKGAFIQMLFESGAIPRPSETAMRFRFGPKWVYFWRDSIMTFPLDAESVSSSEAS